MMWLAPLLALAKRVPWQAWAVAGLLTLAAGYHWQAVRAAHEAGKAEQITLQEKANAKARENAETELRRLDRGDRGRVSGFDRD